MRAYRETMLPLELHVTPVWAQAVAAERVQPRVPVTWRPE